MPPLRVPALIGKKASEMIAMMPTIVGMSFLRISMRARITIAEIIKTVLLTG